MIEPRSAAEFYERLGFGIGEGAFLVKGAAYLYHDQWAREHLPGGPPAQRSALGAMGDHEFFDQIFMAGGMYDVFPLVALGYACAKLRGESLISFVAMRSRYHAELDIRHLRKWLIRLASPAAVARRLPSVLSAYFDFGMPEAEPSEGGMRGAVGDVPAILGPWMIATCRGFGEYALEVNGAKGATITAETEVTGKRERGLEMADLHFDIRWR